MAQEMTKPTVRVKPATTRDDKESLMDRFERLHQAIEQRARRLFEENGWNFGHDLCNWLQAEREVLSPVRLELNETESELILKAEVPGFTEKELEVNVEPNEVYLTGRKAETKEEKEGKTVYSERRSTQLFRRFSLPRAIDPEKTTATIKDGVLEVRLPRAEAQKKIPVRTQAA
jgi:HSP20 family molecular chaperone IbpA